MIKRERNNCFFNFIMQTRRNRCWCHDKQVYKSTTYRASKYWNIVKIYDSLISIHIADRQSHIITAETHKLYRMTNFFEGWRAIGRWKIQSDYRLWLITCIQVIHMCHWFCDKLPIASLIYMYPCFFICIWIFMFLIFCKVQVSSEPPLFCNDISS